MVKRNVQIGELAYFNCSFFPNKIHVDNCSIWPY